MKTSFLASLFALMVLRAFAAAPVLPVESFFGLPSVTRLSFSPDGRYLAALEPWEKRLNLVVIDLEKMQKTQITAMRDNDVAGYVWAGDNRIIFFMDTDGKEQLSLTSVQADGKNPQPFESLRGLRPLGRIRGERDTLVVLANAKNISRSDVYHYNLRTGRAKLHALNPGSFISWIVDHAGVARVGQSFEEGVTKTFYRDSARDEWVQIAEFKDGEPSWSPVAFDGDNKTLFISSNIGRKTAAIYRYDTAKRQFGELVYGDDTYDLDDVIFNEALGRVVGVSYDAERPTVVWIDPLFKQYQRALDAALPDTLVRISEASADNSRLLVRSFSDRQPGEYFLFDVKKNRLEPIGSVFPNLKPKDLAMMHPFSFRARDGLRLHGYLTLPAGVEPKNLPLIINPHGGPFGIRDTWGYNPEVQFYANRGFAVLQLNYRGSGGYGDFFERAGYKKWGLEMQDDLTDAVKWAIAQGIANPSRVVISGASYGGYAAMAGLVFTPELYCAGINYVGVTDIMMLVDNPGLGMQDGRRGEWWRRTRIGDPYADKERLRTTSPANFAERVRVPLLMGYGLNDPRVEIAHGSKVVSKLKTGGRVEGQDFWFLTERYEGHGFAKEENRIVFYRKVDEFLTNQVLKRGVVPEVQLGQPKVIEMPAKNTN